MNISSLVVYAKDDANIENIKAEISTINGCEVVTEQDGKIVVVMSVEDINEEIRTFRLIEAISGVASAAMIYSYQEDIQKDLQSLKESGNISEVLLDENIDAKDIIYGGHVGYKVK